MEARAPLRGARVVWGSFARRKLCCVHPRAFRDWLNPVGSADRARLEVVARELARISLLGEPRWRLAAAGDPAAAVAIAMTTVWTNEIAGLRRDLILTALWVCASAGDPASSLLLAKLRERIHRTERS